MCIAVPLALDTKVYVKNIVPLLFGTFIHKIFLVLFFFYILYYYTSTLQSQCNASRLHNICIIWTITVCCACIYKLLYTLLHTHTYTLINSNRHNVMYSSIAFICMVCYVCAQHTTLKWP